VESWVRPDGSSTRVLVWGLQASGPNAPRLDRAVVVHHGLGEHAGRYGGLAAELARLAPVFAFDARGHGANADPRGDAAGLDGLAAELEAFVDSLRARGVRRLLVLGHSMGAAVVGWWLTQRPPSLLPDAVVLSAPPVLVRKTLGMRVKLASAGLLRRLAPRLTLDNEINPAAISSLPEEVRRYLEDPLVHARVSVRLGYALLIDAPRVLRDASRLTSPLLVLSGAEDPVLHPSGPVQLLEQAGAAVKRGVVFPGARHELHHEAPETRARFVAEVLAWGEAHLPGAGESVP
jgi:alpha-beta hydrolase superfamily lysophospholipase